MVFTLASIGWIAFSWHSLRHPQSHGFFRFFAFEFILALILLNLPVWFRDPFSPAQLISWGLLLSSALLAAHGFRLLKLLGKPSQGIETTTVLVILGAYEYVRHPLYTSLLLLAGGAFLKDPSWVGGFLGGAIALALYLTARAEERENLQKFGQSYAAYMQKSKMFIPFLL